MSDERKIIYVVSNSHWDREWVYPFEETRILLLQFMDELLDLLDNDPAFHSFTMDSQTLCVEDYLELRPEKRETIEKHVRSGRLIIGPWYSLPEEYIVNGESLVRNLVIGHRVAQSLGGVSKTGYTPFSYGQTSQMPQIYRGFDIDTIIFYRGINTPKCEFILEGPDGSRLMGSRFGCMSRFSYYIYVYRMLRYGSSDVFRRYDWDRGAAPFRLASQGLPREHYYVLDDKKKQWNDAPIREQLLKLVRDESEHFSTRHIVCMQGFDSSNPDPEETRIMALCQQLLPEHDIRFSNLAEYMEAMRKEVKDPIVLRGEFRDPGATGKWTHLFGDVISARMRLKQANHRAELNLQRRAEPYSVLAAMVGGEYLKTGLDRAWKMLLQNHPHDTITGGGIDQMEKDALFRFDQINIISNALARKALGQLQIQIDNGDLSPRESVLTVFNPSPFPRKGVISCLIDLPEGMDYDAFELRTPDGARILPIQRREEYPMGVLVRNLQDISVELRTRRVSCHVEVDEVPGLGYATWHVLRTDRFPCPSQTLAPAVNVLENEFLKTEFNPDGTLNLTHKETGRTFTGLHYLEDSGETGHSWIHMEPERNEIITSHGGPCSMMLEESGPLLARMRVDYRMMIPVDLEDTPGIDFREGDLNHTGRTAERREMVITSRFTLRKGSRILEIETTFENTCRHHRLRAVFPTRLRCDRTDAEIAFDVISRDITVKPGNPYYGRPNPQYPMYRFVDMTDGEVGLAVLNNCGIREYEAMDREDRPLAITFIRAFTFRNSPVFGRWETYPDMELAQCPGRFTFTYALYPHAGDWTNGVLAEAETFNMPLEPAQAGPHPGILPKKLSLLSVEGENLQLTSLKRAEDHPDRWVCRIYNPTWKPVTGSLRCWKPLVGAWLVNLNEEHPEPLSLEGDHTVNLKIPAKKIVTVMLGWREEG
ncbi:MAG TPA: glycoside hydrolase family 38 C-terminal domain-containing protein [Candidatus Hydrogenedentes bacterium]|nr:hypothetical protein [Candidatus Hydrogenedentota bacterium]HOK89631.1 glycoside hydrolase family 38 C-terminal domain-containing protein [Candidatus Hydrogenedentota bacterium]HPO29612.1 glycoside hydrolase family 38 C-terminal domain-containing protein [Candidatus Hydrogenedentota bacterium]